MRAVFALGVLVFLGGLFLSGGCDEFLGMERSQSQSRATPRGKSKYQLSWEKKGRMPRRSNRPSPVGAGSAKEHARGVARCYSSYANGGPPINECYEKLPMVHRQAWIRGNQEVRDMMLDMDRRLLALELAYEFSMDTQRLREIRGAKQREDIRQVALMMSESYWNASRMVR